MATRRDVTADSVLHDVQDLLGEVPTAGHEFSELLRGEGLDLDGKPYPMCLRPLVLPHKQVEALKEPIEHIHNLFEKAAVFYSSAKRIPKHYPLYENIYEAISQLPAFRPITQISRFDGILDATGNFSILEMNPYPAGILISGIATRVWEEFRRDRGLLQGVQNVMLPMWEDNSLFLKQLLAAHQQQFGADPEGGAVVRLNDRLPVEVNRIVAGLEELGIPSQPVDARDVRYEPGSPPTAGGNPVTLAYNRLLPRELAAEATQQYIAAIRAGSVCSVNSLMSLCILGDKRIFSVFDDPEFRSSLDAAEIELADKHMPWTRVLEAVDTVAPDGSSVNILKYTIANRESLVIKPSYLCQSQGVVIGPDTDQHSWEMAVTNAYKMGDYVVQEYVAMPTLPVPTEQGVLDMHFGLDFYVFGGCLSGLACRASTTHIISAMKNGCILPVMVEK